MAASGVATGRFVDPDAPAAQEIAVGCIGAGSGVNAVKVFTPNSAGVYGLAATVAGVRADLLRSGRFDDRPGQDLMAIDRAGFQAKFIVGLDLSAQGVHTVDLGSEPTGAATMNLAGPLGVQGAVIATLGVSSNPDSPVGNGTITRWASGSIVVAARINLGDDPLSVTSADFDEDGDDDLAAATTVAGVEQVRLTYNRTSSLMPGTLYFQDGGKMPGEFFRPRIVMACDADTNGVPKLLSVNAGVGSGGSLGPEMDGGIGTFGSGSGQPGDVNGDGVVDGNDMTAVFSAWGTADPVADINDDGNVDAFDMGVILSGWTAP